MYLYNALVDTGLHTLVEIPYSPDDVNSQVFKYNSGTYLTIGTGTVENCTKFLTMFLTSLLEKLEPNLQHSAAADDAIHTLMVFDINEVNGLHLNYENGFFVHINTCKIDTNVIEFEFAIVLGADSEEIDGIIEHRKTQHPERTEIPYLRPAIN